MSRTVVGNLLRDYSRILSETSMDIECIHHYIVYTDIELGVLNIFILKANSIAKHQNFIYLPWTKSI